jgi:DNA polymerase-3 subunit delta
MSKQEDEARHLAEARSAWHKGEFAPLYLFHGEEHFLLDEALDDLLNRAVEPSMRSLNLDILYGGEADARDVVAAASSYPMMGERRVVIVRDLDRISGKEGERDILSSYVEKPSGSTVLVLIANDPDFRQKPFKKIQSSGWAYEFAPIKDYQLPVWIRERVKKSGGTISDDAVEFFQAAVEPNLRDVQNEIEKLFLYAGGRKDLTSSDVQAVVGMRKEHSIYELQRALGEKNVTRALEIMSKLIDAGEDINYFIVSLFRYFSKIYVVQDMLARRRPSPELLKFLRLAPFQTKFAEEYQNGARRFTSKELETVFASLLNADILSKSSQIDHKILLTELVYTISRSKGDVGY